MSSKKAELRSSLRRARRTFAADFGPAASAMIIETLGQWDIFRASTSVGWFWPMLGEPDLREAVRRYPDKVWYLPKCQPEHSLTYGLTRRDTQSGEFLGVEPGSYGIVEPTLAPHRAEEVLDLVLVPGLGFDSRGNRLGQGGGYYDRALAKFSGPKVGVAFPCQMVDHLVVEPHDIQLSAVVLPDRVWRNGQLIMFDRGMAGG